MRPGNKIGMAICRINLEEKFQLETKQEMVLKNAYRRFLFVNTVRINVTRHAKVCNFSSVFLGKQNISGSEIAMDAPPGCQILHTVCHIKANCKFRLGIKI